MQRENDIISIESFDTIHYQNGCGLGISDLPVTLSLKLSEVLYKREIISFLRGPNTVKFTIIIYLWILKSSYKWCFIITLV